MHCPAEGAADRAPAHHRAGALPTVNSVAATFVHSNQLHDGRVLRAMTLTACTGTQRRG